MSIPLLSFMLCNCFHPPYNNFQSDKRGLKSATAGAIVGTSAGTIVGSVLGSIAGGGVAGGIAGGFIGYQKTLQPAIIKELQQQGIEFLQYGDTQVLVVPTDAYFRFNSAKINELSYPGLLNIVRLLNYYPCAPIYVAGFTDNVGKSQRQQKLSQAQAEAMLSFLWANNIKANHLRADGFGAKHPIGNNALIRGSAYNRRLEIQWITATSDPKNASTFISISK